MAQAADYRKRAEECVEIARTARTPAQRTMLMHIADTWERLARDVEDHALPLTPVRKVRRPPVLM
jgi:hypothetical protein